MQNFVRHKVIKTAVGYSDYLQDHNRQDYIVCGENHVDWQRIDEIEAEGNNQARCLLVSLYNKWIDPEKPPEAQREDVELVKARVRDLIIEIFGEEKYNRGEIDNCVHYNKKKNNLHVHILYTERSLLPVKPVIIGQYKKHVYHTTDGKVARNRSERARDENDNIKPPVHRKGDNIVKHGAEYGVKDKKYKTKGWLHTAKQKVKARLEGWGVDIDAPNFIAQKHEGKGNTPIAILNRQYNKDVKRLNKILENDMINGFEFDMPKLKAAFNKDYNSRVYKDGIRHYWKKKDWNKIDISTPLITIDIENEEYKKYYKSKAEPKYKIPKTINREEQAAQRQAEFEQRMAQFQQGSEARIAEADRRDAARRAAEEAKKRERDAEDAKKLEQAKAEPTPPPVPQPSPSNYEPPVVLDRVTADVAVDMPPPVPVASPETPEPPKPVYKPVPKPPKIETYGEITARIQREMEEKQKAKNAMAELLAKNQRTPVSDKDNQFGG